MDFDEVIDRADSNSSRWGGKQNLLALTIGDADFRMPPAIQKAIEARIDHGVMGYDTIPDALEQLLVERLSARYNWQVTQDCLVFLPGVVQGLNIACRAFTAEGESVITETPVYYPFLEAPANSSRGIIELPSGLVDGRWEFDLASFRQLAARPDARLLLLCHPQNPLGRVLTETELRQIAEICLASDVIICSDEIHNDVLFDQHQHVPVASLSQAVADITITLMSPSKAFAMSGLGGAFAVIQNESLRNRFNSIAAGLVPNINVVALAAMEAAYRDCEDWLTQALSYLAANRDYLITALGELEGLQIAVPEATYFLWIDFRQTGINNPHQALIEASLELSNGEMFGGDGFLRLNFASPRSRLEKAVSILSRLVKK